MTLLSAIRAALGGACGPRPTYRDGSAWRMSDAAVAKARAEDPLRTACASHRAEREHLEAANRGLLEVNANLEDQWVPYERATREVEDVDCMACTRVLIRRHLAKNTQPPTK